MAASGLSSFWFAVLVVQLHLSLSTNEEIFEPLTVDLKFPVNEREIEETADQSRFEEVKNDLKRHDQHKRQAGCCTPPTCVFSKYRSMDGTCNNLAHPCWGSAGIPSQRFLLPHYGDGVSTPRGSSSNPSLPRPRDVSIGITSVPSFTNDPITLMLMQWGQFLDHDMTLTRETPNVTGCCNGGSTHADCFPIFVTGDPFYSNFGVTCIPFVRSAKTSCPPGSTREQINDLTAYIDCSQIYGSSVAQMNNLRVSGSYLLKFGPDRENPSSTCTSTTTHYDCRVFLPTRPAPSGTEFFAGDGRVEEQPGLTSIHAIFLRMHNDLSSVIKNLNPSCSNDVVFQETRKILGAVAQQITYGEFLPLILDTVWMKNYSLTLGGSNAYNSSIDATVPSAFATASFRFGHSLIKGVFTLPGTTVNLAENFNRHSATKSSGKFPSHFMRGIVADQSAAMDHIIDEAVQNKLFAQTPFNFGEDLFSRNIQRGRDHGLPGYRFWINACNRSNVINSFDDLYAYNNLMPRNVIDKLKSLYGGRINDVDLFPAGIAETSPTTSLLGPTFSCINAEYFHRLKFGDRYWFERNSFTSNQLQSIRETTLSSILCLYTDAISMQPRAMELPTRPGNGVVSCSNLVSEGVLNDITLYWNNLCTPSG